MNLVKLKSYAYDEEHKGAESPSLMAFQSQANKERAMLRTPNQRLREQAKSSNTDMSEGDMIKTDIHYEESEAGLDLNDLKFMNSMNSVKDVDSENCSLDHTLKVEVN